LTHLANSGNSNRRRFCFETLVAKLRGKDLPQTHFQEKDLKAPLFVTWNIQDRPGAKHHLRGCIGNFDDLVLGPALRDYALISALEDTRFSPITLNELERLEVCVSLLVNFEHVTDVWDWEVGKHGIRISFVDPSTHTNRSGTFLPEVALEQGWSKEQTLLELTRKAGYRGPWSEAFANQIQLVRYQSSKERMTYAEFSSTT